jgi:hypothetical protein
MEPPRVERISHVMLNLFMRMLVFDRGLPIPEALQRVMNLLRGCQSRN